MASTVQVVPPQTLLEFDFSKGVVSDIASTALSPGQLVSCVNFMLDKPGYVYKRGSSQYVGGTCGTGAVLATAVAEFPAPNTTEVLAWSNDLNLYRLVSTTWTSAGAYGGSTGYAPATKPAIVPSPSTSTTRGIMVWGVGAGNDTPRVYTGGGSAPRAINVATGLDSTTGGRYALTYKGRLVLASSTNYENRIWFSPDFATGVETAWDLGANGAWIDADHGITGIAALRNVLLVFSRAHTERITGDIPPGFVNSNMAHGTMFNVGCSGARSISYWNDNVLWAHTTGVYMSDGTSIHNLTEEGGIRTSWRQIMTSFSEAGGDYVTGEVYRDFYLINAYIGGIQFSYILYIPKRAWWTLDPASASWLTANPLSQKLYANDGTNRVLDFSRYFTSASGVDADGSAVTAILVSRDMNAGSPGIKHYREGRLTYFLNGDDTSLEVVVSGQQGTGRVTTLPSATEVARKRFDMNLTDTDVNIQFENNDDTGTCLIYGAELDYQPFPIGRGGAS